MKLFSLACRHCGAPLEVPTKLTQFKCLFCGSTLHVQWGDSVANQEVRESAPPWISELAKSPEQLRVEQEIELVDDAWKKIRARFMIRGHDGQLRVPDKDFTLGSGMIGVLLGIAAVVMGITAGWWGGLRDSSSLLMMRLLPAVGVLLIVLVVAKIRHELKKADDFKVHQKVYQDERQRLLAELEKQPFAVVSR